MYTAKWIIVFLVSAALLVGSIFAAVSTGLYVADAMNAWVGTLAGLGTSLVINVTLGKPLVALTQRMN